MNEAMVLNLVRLPARLNSTETAQVLGFGEHDIAVLAKNKLLKCLGNPAPNAPKYLATREVEKLAADPDWLHKATKAVRNHWQIRNRNQRSGETCVQDHLA